MVWCRPALPATRRRPRDAVAASSSSPTATWAGGSGERRSKVSGLGLDQAEVAVLAPVEHVHAVGLGVAEDEQAVVAPINLQDRLLDGHGLEEQAPAADHP